MSTIVETQYGKVEGTRRGAHTVFRGIPYAMPPVGDLRFRAPEPPAPWSGVRPALEYSASSLQGAMFAPGVVALGPQSEDCLYLNVFTPATDAKKRPVLFWIHGGAFTVGSASQPLYDATRLVERDDVVVVTINYRLGALGYLSFGADGDRWGAVDNRGQHDQLAALTWVRDNIEHFGGDPANVTIFGESAGASAVSLLLVTPRARGLFKRAIAQSSAVGLELATREHAGAITQKLLETVGLASSDAARLCALPIEALTKAQAIVESDTATWPQFYPIVDGALLPAQPGELLAQGHGSDVSLILGNNRDEWNLFALMTIAEWSKPLPESEAIEKLRRKLPTHAASAAAALLETYRQSRRERGLPYGERALLRAIEGDLRFRMPALRLAERHVERQAATYVYLFSYESPALQGALGACHALELPFVFGTYDGPGQAQFVGEGEVVETLSRTIGESWTSFARSGQPSSAGYASWPAYDLVKRPTLEFAASPQLVDDPYASERRAWDGLI
jgi:para-nitrobenzyl esterase